jgi:hypothetical protein
MTSTIKVNTIQNTCGADIIKESGNTITIGASGDTVTLGSGASQTGFGRTGTVDWQTGSIKTSTFTAASGEGYFCNTAGGAFTVNLPAGSAGAIVSVQDYNNTFDSNNLTVDANGSEKINGGDGGEPVVLDTKGRGVTFVYIDSTVGWRSVQDNDFTKAGTSAAFIAASGGNSVVTCGDFKTHIFTGPGTFTVSCAGNACGSNSVEYLVVAGGGAGGTGQNGSAGGGGAGGFRARTALPGAPPLNAPANLPVSVQAYSIAVGAGGGNESKLGPLKPGSVSTFSTITSAGGGAGRPGHDAVCGTPGYNPVPAMNGGSGGGATGNCGPGAASTGNSPPTNPAQGTNGGAGNLEGGTRSGGGGGGAGQAGQNGVEPLQGGFGGNGSFIPTAFIGPTAPSYGCSPTPLAPNGRYFSGGGGGAVQSGCNMGAGGAGGGKPAANPQGGQGAVNTGGGGGAGGNDCTGSGTGGSGIVMIRYKFQ